MTDTTAKKSAADWLAVAVKYEIEGRQSIANKALERAIQRDAAEHSADSASASLPRVAA